MEYSRVLIWRHYPAYPQGEGNMNSKKITYFKGLGLFWVIILFLITLPGEAFGDNGISPGDTAWVLVASALVLFMMIPGLALFYGGLVRTKNVLSVLMQCFAITALISILWLVYGYSLAFDSTGMVQGKLGLHSIIGGLSKVFMTGVTPETLWGNIPETVFSVFQLTFAIITPGLIIGAFAERMKFSAVLWFSGLWFTFVYLPVCHMVWGGPGALLADMGVLDFAGGIVVHMTAGVSALLTAILVGKRKGYGTTPMIPHNLTVTLAGTGMLWVGWFGFNGGSALAANGQAGMAVLVTQIAPSTAALTWMAIEWVTSGKPSALGFATGAIAGLAAITPASGTVGPLGALVIGCTAALVCNWASTSFKKAMGYDDALDVVGVHGVGGIVGTLLVAVFGSAVLGGSGVFQSIPKQLGVQLIATIGVLLFSSIVSFVILKAIEATIGLRVTEDEEVMGLDVTQHEEVGYDF
jgi:ammonium transporter, Amt family